ncbi:probable flavin-containing monooxygenase 1 [Argentina anserina]|uniref:probable flavin-containing monooxygenase 1 n=1 Tax=Argentina anserina TaxID=57926 RepID=UPI0021768DF0|nr:probable flavin-containing monooxygenase 1 [Potentilla anserina]
MTFTFQVINEIIRAGNTAPGLLRRALADIPLKGFTIPAGKAILSTQECPQHNRLSIEVFSADFPFGAETTSSSPVCRRFQLADEVSSSPSRCLPRHASTGRVDIVLPVAASLFDRSCLSLTYVVDFVILCVGRFSDVPNIPEYPPNKGPESFHGKVIHSMEYANMDDESAAKFVTGKQVIVVGSMKYGMDIAMECSNANGIENPCTLLYRTVHWTFPDYRPWGVSLALLYFTRFSELLVHKPGEGFLLSLLATFLSLLRWAFSKFVETYINQKLGLYKYGMVPKHSFLQDISSCVSAIVPEKFYDRVQEGSIILKKSPSGFGFVEEGILVEGDASPLKTELVILATGFRGDKKLKDIFVSPTFQDYIMGQPDAILPLYRECIQGRIPQLAVIGFSESIFNLYTSEIRCRWLSELLAGTFKVPSIKEMEKDVQKWDKYAKQYAGEYYRRSCIGALHIWYNDQLCKDMGWSHKRKKGIFAELFEPYGPMDYVSP